MLGCRLVCQNFITLDKFNNLKILELNKWCHICSYICALVNDDSSNIIADSILLIFRGSQLVVLHILTAVLTRFSERISPSYSHQKHAE